VEELGEVVAYFGRVIVARRKSLLISGELPAGDPPVAARAE